jgi:hypothetical protein
MMAHVLAFAQEPSHDQHRTARTPISAMPITALTDAMVIAALSGSIGLLFGTIWRRFAITPGDGSVSSSSHHSPEDHHDHDA